jgi:hypothetical protein
MIELSGGVQDRREYFAGHVALSSITVLVLLFDTTKMALDANRAHADHPVRCGANGHADPGLRNWAAEEPTWGIWNIGEAQAGVLPADLQGRDSIELGCGTGYVSAWLARRGARPGGAEAAPPEHAAGLRPDQDPSSSACCGPHRVSSASSMCAAWASWRSRQPVGGRSFAGRFCLWSCGESAAP